MNNDDDLLETNRFITGVDVNLDGENPYLNTEASYKNFLKTNFKVDVDNYIKDDLLRRETYDDLLDEEEWENDDKTIEKKLVKQKKLEEAIDNSQEQLQTLSKIYHNLECTRFERKFEKR